MKNFLNARFLVFGAIFLVGVFFISQAIFGRNIDGGESRGLIGGGDLEEPTPLNTGKVGVWSKIGEFPTPRERHSLVFFDGYVYVLGGTIGWAFDGAVTSTVLYAPFNGRAGFGDWRYAPNIPGAANFDGAAFVANGYVYVVGGSDRVNHSTNEVWFSRIGSDHALQAWASTTPLPLSVSYHEVVYRNGFAYLIGGRHLDSPTNYQTNEVYYAPVQEDGSLGNWFATASLPVPLSGHAAVINGDYLYVFGGANDAGFPGDPVFYSKFNADGSLGSWVWFGEPLPTKAVNLHAESLGRYVYIFGGSKEGVGAMDSVYYGKTNSDGSLSAWTKTTSMMEKLSRTDGFVSGQQIVIVGGQLDLTGPGNVSRSIWSAFTDVTEGL